MENTGPLGQKCQFFMLLVFYENKLLLKYFYIFIFCSGRVLQRYIGNGSRTLVSDKVYGIRAIIHQQPVAMLRGFMRFVSLIVMLVKVYNLVSTFITLQTHANSKLALNNG